MTTITRPVGTLRRTTLNIVLGSKEDNPNSRFRVWRRPEWLPLSECILQERHGVRSPHVHSPGPAEAVLLLVRRHVCRVDLDATERVATFQQWPQDTRGAKTRVLRGLQQEYGDLDPIHSIRKTRLETRVVAPIQRSGRNRDRGAIANLRFGAQEGLNATERA